MSANPQKPIPQALFSGSLELTVFEGDLYDKIEARLALHNVWEKHLTLLLTDGLVFALYDAKDRLICRQNIYDLNRSRSFEKVLVKKACEKSIGLDFYIHHRDRNADKLSRARYLRIETQLNHRIGKIEVELVRTPALARPEELSYCFRLGPKG